jgi:hypothetical protein
MSHFMCGERLFMNTKKVLLIGAAVLGTVALAAPSLRLTSSAVNNGKASGNAIYISAYTKLPIVSRSNNGSSVVLVYQGKDAAEPFKFYKDALEKNGWKEGHAMGGDTMGAMDKPADGSMAKTDGTMTKPADGSMAKTDGTMAKTDGAMDKGDAMMNKGLEASFAFNKVNLTLKASMVNKEQIKVSIDLK